MGDKHQQPSKAIPGTTVRRPAQPSRKHVLDPGDEMAILQKPSDKRPDRPQGGNRRFPSLESKGSGVRREKNRQQGRPLPEVPRSTKPQWARAAGPSASRTSSQECLKWLQHCLSHNSRCLLAIPNSLICQAAADVCAEGQIAGIGDRTCTFRTLASSVKGCSPTCLVQMCNSALRPLLLTLNQALQQFPVNRIFGNSPDMTRSD